LIESTSQTDTAAPPDNRAARRCARRRGGVRAWALCMVAGGALALLASCGGAARPDQGSGAMPTITITQADKGKTFEVRPGDTLRVELAENPTTGYRWAIDRTDERIVELAGSEYQPAPSSGVGGGGLRTFTFKALRPGAARVELKYWREWQGDSSIVERFDCTIDVKA